MPNLKHLLDDLLKIGVDPDDVQIPAQLFDDIVADAEESAEDDED